MHPSERLPVSPMRDREPFFVARPKCTQRNGVLPTAPFVPFRVRSHGASCKSFQNKPEDANASPNHVPILRKMAQICGCERSHRAERAQKTLRFYKTPGHDLPRADTVRSLSCTTANLCQKIDNWDQVSGTRNLLRKTQKQTRSKPEEKRGGANERRRGKGRGRSRAPGWSIWPRGTAEHPAGAHA